jgi:hypothetical protein
LQSFDNGPGNWVGQNNIAPALNNYTWSNTNNTGGASPAGEAGGTYARTSALAYFADTGVNQPAATEPFFDLFDRFSASGELNLKTTSTANSFFGVGHFDRGTDQNVLGQSMLGFTVGQASPTTYAITSVAVAQGGQSVNLAAGQYLWNYTYDPNFSGNDGRLTVEIRNMSNVVLHTLVSNVVFGAKDGRSASGTGPGLHYFNIDSFGIASGQSSTNLVADTLEAYIDGVSYTMVPEPSSLALAGALGALTVRRRRR